jgi:hypothetical protein
LGKLKKYIDENKKRPSTSNKNKEIKILGAWLSKQKLTYKKCAYVMAYKHIREKWEAFVEQYKDYFPYQILNKLLLLLVKLALLL